MLTLGCLLAGLAGPVPAKAELVLQARDAQVTAPMTLVDGALRQPVRTELPAGGTAVFTFKIPVAGDYILRAIVDAPAGDANSFYVNLDTPATDPGMVWDIPSPYTTGFEERAVTWRGNGYRDEAEFDPKVFTLTAGEHRLIVTGREPARLQSLTLHPYEGRTPGTLAFIQQSYRESDKQMRFELFRLHETGTSRPEDEKAVYQKRQTQHAGQFAEALRLADTNSGQPLGLAALAWVLQATDSHYQDSGPQAVAWLARDYAADPGVGPTVAYLSHYLPYPGQPMELGTKGLFEAVVRRNQDRTARGQAHLGLARLAKRDFDALEATDKGEAAQVAGRNAIALMETVRRDYGDCPYLLERREPLTLGQKAGRELVELRALRLGMPAPDIVAPDLAGTTFKLSDYRGKVVMLVFWASWCGPCMQAVPHEKEIVERYQGRPFVLIGVNGNSQLKDAQKAVAKNQIPWRSFWNGPDEAITKAWNVLGWPTVYLIDHTGIIQQRMFLDETRLEALVAAAEREKGKP